MSSSDVSMDELDRRILQTLQADGRTPFAEIARQVNVSETTVRTRYQGLVEKGIVRTVAIVDPYALGFQAPAILVISAEPAVVDEVARAIERLPEVSYLVMTLGASDLIAEVFCRDLPHLTRLITQQVYSIPGVRSAEALMIARSHKLSFRWSPESA